MLPGKFFYFFLSSTLAGRNPCKSFRVICDAPCIREVYLIFLIMLPKLGSSECLFYDPIRRKLPGEPQIKSSILSALRSCTVKTYVIFCPSLQFLNLSDHGIFFSPNDALQLSRAHFENSSPAVLCSLFSNSCLFIHIINQYLLTIY